MTTKPKPFVRNAIIVGAAVAAGLTAVTLWVRAAATPTARVFAGHTGRVWSLAWSPDGRHLASGSGDTTVRVWNVATGGTERILTRPRKEVADVAYSPDGLRIAAGSDDNTVSVWDAATGAPIGPPLLHRNPVTDLVFSPDGKYLASSSGGDRTVKLWDAHTLRLMHVLRGHTDWVRAIAFSPDGKTIATADQKTTQIWDAATGKRRRMLAWAGPYARCLLFAPDNETLLCAAPDSVSVGNAMTGARSPNLEVYGISRAAFLPDGVRLVTANGYEVQICDARTGVVQETVVHRPPPEPRPWLQSHWPAWLPDLPWFTYGASHSGRDFVRITAMQLSPDGKTIAYAKASNVYLVAVPPMQSQTEQRKP